MVSAQVLSNTAAVLYITYPFTGGGFVPTIASPFMMTVDSHSTETDTNPGVNHAQNFSISIESDKARP